MGCSQSQPQLQPHYSEPQLQPEPHESARRESRSLSPEGNTKPSKNSTKAVNNKGYIVTAVEHKQHSYQYTLKDADSPLHKPSAMPEDLFDQLYSGVFFDNNSKKYWMEKKSHVNCFMLYARSFFVTWGEDERYWEWVQHKEESGTTIELANLLDVCWLDVRGKFEIRKLSPGILYRVSFIIMLRDSGRGWGIPINFRLILPGGKKQEHQEKLMDKPKERWIEIPVGEFEPSEKDFGEMEITLYEHESNMWKSGLVVQGVVIKPKH